MNLLKSEITSNRKINYRDLMIFAVPILIFALYLFIYNPGILTYDSFAQIHQIAGGEFTSRFPFFHTFIEMLLLNIFHTPLVIAALQILIFSAIWTAICKYHRDDTEKSSNRFVLEFAVTLIICLIPINAVYSISLWSEILFAYALLFLSFLIKVMIDRNGQVSKKFIIIMALTIAVASQLSLNGLPIAIVTLIIIAVYLLRKNNNKKLVLMLPAIAIVAILLISSLSFIYGVEGTQSSEFNPASSAIVFDITRNADWNGQVYYISSDGAHLENAKDKFFTGINQTPKESYEDVTSPNVGHGNYNMVSSYVTAFKDNHILDTLFNSPALYMYLAIILLVSMFVMTRSKDLFLIYVPNLLNIIAVIMTSPVQENRFLYGNLLVFYLLVIIFISVMFASDRKALPITLNAQKARESTKREPEVSPYEYQDFDINQNQYEEVAMQLDDSALNDINAFLDKQPQEPEPEYNNELLDEILKEIEMEKQDKD